MPTRVSPNCVDIFQEEVDFKSPISEGLLVKMAANINAACESLTPTCTLDTQVGTRTYNSLPGSQFIMVFGVGGGGGGGGIRSDILDHNTSSGTLNSGTSPTAGFENGEPGLNTIFNGQAVAAGGRGGGEAVAYAIAQKRSPISMFDNGVFDNVVNLFVNLQFFHGQGFGRRQLAPDNDGYSYGLEEFVVSPFGGTQRIFAQKWMDPRAFQLGQDAQFLNGSLVGRGGDGGSFGSSFRAGASFATTNPVFDEASLGNVSIRGGGGQTGQRGQYVEKSIPNASYTYTVGAGGDNGGVSNIGLDTIGSGASPLFRLNHTTSTTTNAQDGSSGGILIIDWGHS